MKINSKKARNTTRTYHRETPDLPLSIENGYRMMMYRIPVAIDERTIYVHGRIDKQEGNASSMNPNRNTENHRSQNELN